MWMCENLCMCMCVDVCVCVCVCVSCTCAWTFVTCVLVYLCMHINVNVQTHTGMLMCEKDFEMKLGTQFFLTDTSDFYLVLATCTGLLAAAGCGLYQKASI